MAEVKKLGWNNVKVLTTLPGRSGIVARLGKDAVEGLHGIGGWQIHDASQQGTPEHRSSSPPTRPSTTPTADENAANAYSYTDWFIAILQAAGRNLTAESLRQGRPPALATRTSPPTRARPSPPTT